MNAKAQTGWQWGVSASINSTGFETVATAIDRSGNVFGANTVYQGSGSCHFGTTTVNVTMGSTVFTKMDSSGKYLWAIATQTINGSSGNNDVDMVTDPSGNLYVVGSYATSTFSLGTLTLSNPDHPYVNMYFILKISPVGNVLWGENISTDSIPFDGYHDATCNIGIDGSGNVYVFGNFSQVKTIIGTATLVNAKVGTNDIYVAKYDPLGNSIWAKRFGGKGDDLCASMLVTDSGNIYLGGEYHSDTMTIGTVMLTGSTNYLCKLDSSGTCIWANNMSRHTFVNAIAADRAQNVYVAGSIDSTIVLGVDTLTFEGRNHRFPSDSAGWDVGDAFIAKFDPRGNMSWATSAGGDSNDVAWDIAVDSCQNVWICGTMGSSVFNPPYSMNFSGHILTNTYQTSDLMFIAAYDDNGKYINSMASLIGGDDWAYMTVDNKGSFYIAGDYSYTFLSPLLSPPLIYGADTLPSAGYELPFFAKYRYGHGNCDIVLQSPDVKNNSTSREIKIYPNPGAFELTVVSTEKITSIAITNLIGQTVFSNFYHTEEVQVDVSNLPSGIYLIRINGTEVRRFVKQ